MIEREFLCSLGIEEHEEPVYAESRSKARYKYWLRVTESGADFPMIQVRVRVGRPPSPPSDEWRKIGLTERQRHIARHALGFDGGQNKQSYRNHYCIGPEGDTYGEWMDLVGKGLATRYAGSELTGGSDEVFHCTRKLALAVREGYECIIGELAAQK